MRIWQRIFLAVLALVTAAIYLTGIFLLKNQFNRNMSTELSFAEKIQSNFYQMLDYELFYQKTSEQKIVYDDTLYQDVLSALLKQKEFSQHGMEAEVSRGISSSNEKYREMPVEEPSFEEHNASYFLEDYQDRYYFVLMSVNTLYDREVRVISQHDVTFIYNEYEEQLSHLQYYCIVLSTVAAFVLLLIILVQLHPLKKLRIGIHRIAKGDYSGLVLSHGKTELSELADDVNKMAEEISTNVSRLEELSENRKIFIGNMAHEMKTPLTSILGFADILSIKPEMTQEERREYSEIIVKEATRLRAMSGKLMELVFMQENSISMHPVELSDLIGDVMEAQFFQLKEKSLRLDAQLVTKYVQGDADLLKSLFINLIDNARKASPKGERIEITMLSEQDGVSVRIRDYGPGIPAAELEKIKEPFYMLDRSRTRKEGGAGLGLALCSEIVKLHNGKFSIESTSGKGTVVTVWFPVFRGGLGE